MIPGPVFFRVVASFSCCIILGLLQVSSAFACFSPGSIRSIFLADIPPASTAPAVAQIRVIRLMDSVWRDDGYTWMEPRRSFIGMALVDRVIRGPIDQSPVKVVVLPTSCDNPIAAGESGLVAGTLRMDDKRVLELHAIGESHDERIKRRNAK